MQTNIIFKHICREDTYMFNYTQLPDELFTVDLFATLSLHAKVLYSFMLRRISISKDNNWIDDAGYVYIYYRVDEIMGKFNCSNKTAAKIMAELEDIGLIEKKRQGQGKPDIIYVNKFSEITENQEEEPKFPIEHMELLSNDIQEEVRRKIPEVKNLHFQKCKKYISKSVENTSLEVNDLHTNYKEKNYKESINSSSLSPPNDFHEKIHLLEEEKENYRRKIKYQEAERAYSANIAAAVFAELIKRDREYLSYFTADMFARICKAISSSKEPIIFMPGFVNWCMDRISHIPTSKTGENARQFCQFPQREYDFEELERELLR